MKRHTSYDCQRNSKRCESCKYFESVRSFHESNNENIINFSVDDKATCLLKSNSFSQEEKQCNDYCWQWQLSPDIEKAKQKTRSENFKKHNGATHNSQRQTKRKNSNSTDSLISGGLPLILIALVYPFWLLFKKLEARKNNKKVDSEALAQESENNLNKPKTSKLKIIAAIFLGLIITILLLLVPFLAGMIFA